MTHRLPLLSDADVADCVMLALVAEAANVFLDVCLPVCYSSLLPISVVVYSKTCLFCCFPCTNSIFAFLKSLVWLLSLPQGVATDAASIDTLFVLAIGFPPHWGGPLSYIDLIGAKQVRRNTTTHTLSLSTFVCVATDS